MAAAPNNEGGRGGTAVHSPSLVLTRHEHARDSECRRFRIINGPDREMNFPFCFGTADGYKQDQRREAHRGLPLGIFRIV